MAGLLEMNGAQPQKAPRYVPLFVDRMFTGIYSQRAILHDPSDAYTAKFYGGRPDALLDGSNIELTNRLTLQRRPGLSSFSTATYPTAPNRAFSFELINGTIRVIIDTGSSGSLTLSAVANASAGSSVYTGTFPNAGSNAYAGLTFLIAGFTNNTNNGSFVCTASTTTTLTLSNASGAAETHAATAVTAGGVYWDQQSGGLKTLLFGKAAGAGQTYFVAVAGVLYMGDGVDTKKYTPLNLNGTVWNWGIATPTAQPSVTITSSGASAVQWVANTVWSTMGLIHDTSTGTAQQLNSVNASLLNATRFGTSGDGQPAWNQTPGGTTTDNTITWTNFGPIVAWTAFTDYSNATTGGTVANPCIVYDPATKSCYIQSNSSPGLRKSGSAYPSFKPGPGQHTNDGAVVWIWIGAPGTPGTWQKSTSYPRLGTVSNNDSVSSIVEPVGLQNGLPTNQTVYWQTSAGGTSAGSAVAPKWNIVAGNITGGDGDLLWLSLGSDTWAGTTAVSQWLSSGTAFSVVKDTNGNFQVCTTTGTTGGSPPTWGAGYGVTTTDGTAVWTCVGTAMSWAAATKWYLPIVGFSPPSPSSPFGGASVIDSNSDVEFIVNSGLGGGSAPSWAAIGSYTVDNPTTLVLTQVTVVGATTTYTGTITGGGSNALVGHTYLISGFTTAGNNVLITVTASTATTLVTTTTSQVNETHAGAASTGAIWYNLEAFSANSLSWTKGYIYAYSFKSRALDDYYSQASIINGVSKIPIPPGLTNILPVPSGSQTNPISTASPIFTITGPNAGAVNTVSGVGSTDPQVDTIVIWRTADGGGPGDLFELTEIPAPQAIGGIAQPWSFDDFLPDTPTNLYPGLDPLIPAPIDDTNDPPPAGFLPMVFNFQRIWGANGSQVPWSGGPDVLTGNPNEAFNPADEFPFLAPVIALVKTSQGIVTFLPNSVEIIAGGPLTTSFYSVTLAHGTGVRSYNAVDAYAGEIFVFGSDSQFRTMSPSLALSNAGFPIGDKFAAWDSSKVYVAVHQSGVDNCIMVSDGLTGWYRVNPYQVPGLHGPEPIWSPFANITGGCQMVQSVETSLGQKKLLVGATSGGHKILARDLTLYTDDGSTYDAQFTMGSIVLAHPGQLAVLKFIEMDLSGVSFQPTVSFLLNEISGSFTPFTLPPQFDPPTVYGSTIIPGSYSPNRYYFNGVQAVARCRHMQLKVDFGSTSVGDEIYNLTIVGRILVET